MGRYLEATLVGRLRHKPLIWQGFSEFFKGNVCISGETRSCFGRGAAFSDINTFWGNGFRLKKRDIKGEPFREDEPDTLDFARFFPGRVRISGRFGEGGGH